MSNELNSAAETLHGLTFVSIWSVVVVVVVDDDTFIQFIKTKMDHRRLPMSLTPSSACRFLNENLVLNVFAFEVFSPIRRRRNLVFVVVMVFEFVFIDVSMATVIILGVWNPS